MTPVNSMLWSQTEVDVEQARMNMVEQQVRPWDVLDQRVLDLMQRAPRELFVPQAYRSVAFADISVPLLHDEVMLPPRMEARTLQSLTLDARDRVLEIGTGSGFFTYLLCALSGHVFSMELHPELAEIAARNLAANNAHNVTLECADGIAGRAQHAPYDVIVLTGSVPNLPEVFRRQLAVGGRLFVVVGDEPAMEACLITRVGEDQWSHQSLFETVVPPLRNLPVEPRFEL